MVRRIMIPLAAIAIASVMAASTAADARGGGGGHGGGMGGGHGGGFHGGGGRRLPRRGIGGGFRGGGMGGGFRGVAVGGGFRSAMVGGGFRGAGFRRGVIGPRNFAFRPGFAPRFNRVAFGRFGRFHHRRFAFAAVPFVAGVGLYGSSCWSWQPTPWGWQRVWACGYDYGYY